MLESSQNSQRTCVEFYTVTSHESGQRIDNFLMKKLKSLPRSVVYRIIRKGEVRIDKKRVKPDRKIQIGNIVRIPPVTLNLNNDVSSAPEYLLKQIEQSILLEDKDIIFINKPSGLAVHGGSGIRFGLIETFRQLRPNLDYIELVHRLDKETSGIVMLAKNRQTLTELHKLLRDDHAGKIKKQYQALVLGPWREAEKTVKLELKKQRGQWQKMQVQAGGKIATSIFRLNTNYSRASLLNVQILTGRMHQIRTQLAYLNFPILGDDRYGDFKANRNYQKYGLKRLFLHAVRIRFYLSTTGQSYDVKAPLADDLQKVLQQLEPESNNE
jgi:23S rRNA pseudouridine955/2504/2580 synthase